MKALVTGGVRSGKSFHAESLVIGEPHVAYVTLGQQSATTQSRRPSEWATVETHDLATAIANADGAIIADCVDEWVRWQIGELDGWDAVREDWEPIFLAEVDRIADAVGARSGVVVLVSQEAGFGGECENLRAQLFRELLGVTNQRLAMECDQVMLVVAGRVLTL